MSLPKEGSRDTGEGIIVSLTPDVCKTPVGSSLVPIPYSVVAYQSDDANTASTVRMTKLRAHKFASVVTKTIGDQPGSAGGVKSGTVGAACHPKTHSATVNIEGSPTIRHTDEWWMNNRNTVGKLTYVKSTETFTPTHAIDLSQDPHLEAPDPGTVDTYVQAILGGMARAQTEGLPEGSYQVAQALPMPSSPLPVNPRIPTVPSRIPSTRPPTRTPRPANDNVRPAQPGQPNRVARETSLQPPAPLAGPLPGAPGGAAGQAIAALWQQADALMSGPALRVSPDIHTQAAAGEAAITQWAADYSAANNGAPVPDYVWGAEQESLNAVRLPALNSVTNAARDPAEGRAILNAYAEAHDIQPADLTEEEIRDILSSEDPMSVRRTSPGAQSEVTPDGARVSRRGDEEEEEPCERTIAVDSSRAPQSSQHMRDAWVAGYPSVLTLCKACADANRAASLRGIPTMPGMDRDEYPPAMFLEGGAGASVRHLPYSDNRSAGAQIGNRLKGVPEGCRITLTIR